MRNKGTCEGDACVRAKTPLREGRDRGCADSSLRGADAHGADGRGAAVVPAEAPSAGRGVAAHIEAPVAERPAYSWRDFFSLRMVGFALADAWVGFLFVYPLSPLAAQDIFAREQMISSWSVALCVALAVVAAVARFRDGWLRGPALPGFGAAGAGLGTLLLVAADLYLPASLVVPMVVAGSVASAVGWAALSVRYALAYGEASPMRLHSELPLSFVASSLIIVVLSLASQPLMFAACVALPIAAAAVPLSRDSEQSARRAKGDVDGVERPCRAGDSVADVVVAAGQAKRMVRFASSLGLCGLLVSFANAFADGAARAMALSATGQYFDNLGQASFVAAGLVAAAFVYLCLRFLADGIAASYRVVMLVMAAFLVLSPIFGQMGPLAVSVALLQQGAFNILFFIIVARAMAAQRADAVGVFCVSWGMATAGQLAGWVVAGLFGALLFAIPNAGMVVALVSVALVSAAYMFVLPEAKLNGLMGSEDPAARRAASAPGDESGGRKRAFQEKCQVVAREHGLTEREAEVMVLLAKGRTRARIQEELFLSSGTVSTHVRHIYQKIGVHSKQELLDVIEGAGGAS